MASDMTLLIVGLAIFISIHILPWRRGWRKTVIGKLGEKAYKGLFAVVALTGLIVIIVGKARADFHHLWAPPPWGHVLALPLMLVAIILLAAANLPGNIKRFTRHPMLWGVTLWSCAHLLANGDLAAAILFGAFGIYALLAMLSANIRGAMLQTQRQPITKDLIIALVGIAVFSGLLLAHPYLFGAAVI